MKKFLVISTVMFVMGAAALADDSIKSPCGTANVSGNTDDIGGVCVSVCGSEFAYNSCTTSRSQAPAAPGKSPGPATVIDFLSVRVFGDDFSVAELAAALEQATGWTVDVPSDLESETIRPAKKRLSGGDARALRFRLQNGVKLSVSVDNDHKKIAVSSS